jgi:hypothetical protein
MMEFGKIKSGGNDFQQRSLLKPPRNRDRNLALDKKGVKNPWNAQLFHANRRQQFCGS